MDTEVNKIKPPGPYLVGWGFYPWDNEERFDTFEAALKLYAEKRAELKNVHNRTVIIMNEETCDGADDAANPRGLTEDERAAVEEVAS